MPRLSLAYLDSVVSPCKRYCILCVLTPELREALTTVPNPSIPSFRRVVLRPAFPYDRCRHFLSFQRYSFVFVGLPRVIFNVSLVFSVKLSNSTDDLPVFESFLPVYSRSTLRSAARIRGHFNSPTNHSLTSPYSRRA